MEEQEDEIKKLNEVASVVLTGLLGWFSNRTGTSVDDGTRKSNNWLDQWQSGKLSTGSRVKTFPRAFPWSTDVRSCPVAKSAL